MAEYIEKDKAINTVFEAFADGRSAYIALEAIPAADVVPVVRCKDCRHIHIGKNVYYCRYWESWGITPGGFCSGGAKMEGEA